MIKELKYENRDNQQNRVICRKQFLWFLNVQYLIYKWKINFRLSLLKIKEFRIRDYDQRELCNCRVMQLQKTPHKKIFNLAGNESWKSKIFHSIDPLIRESFRSLPSLDATFMASGLDYTRTTNMSVRILKALYNQAAIFKNVRQNKVKPLLLKIQLLFYKSFVERKFWYRPIPEKNICL